MKFSHLRTRDIADREDFQHVMKQLTDVPISRKTIEKLLIDRNSEGIIIENDSGVIVGYCSISICRLMERGVVMVFGGIAIHEDYRVPDLEKELHKLLGRVVRGDDPQFIVLVDTATTSHLPLEQWGYEPKAGGIFVKTSA
jgi:hypothetical protein